MHRVAGMDDLEVELMLVYEIEPYDGPPPWALPAHDPWLEIEHELVDAELVDPWFQQLDDDAPVALPTRGDVFEIDPVHPLRRLGSWVRAGSRRAS
jgi:hypothetical protein